MHGKVLISFIGILKSKLILTDIMSKYFIDLVILLYKRLSYFHMDLHISLYSWIIVLQWSQFSHSKAPFSGLILFPLNGEAVLQLEFVEVYIVHKALEAEMQTFFV